MGGLDDLSLICVQLRDDACRLLTITGLGGVGKTRLALEAANRLASAQTNELIFGDGIYFVSLVGVVEEFAHAAEPTGHEDADVEVALMLAIANAMGYPVQNQSNLKQQFLGFLRDKRLLLVLGSFEHLFSHADLVVNLLHNAPQLKLLITSRVALRCQGEWLLRLEGLSVPAPTESVLPTSVISRSMPVDHGWQTHDACVLFLLLARQIDLRFDVAKADAPSIVKICQLTEGLPLGIELAASWLRVQDCATIADQLQQALDLPTQTQERSTRHRTLRAVFDHSWSLLDGAEQKLLKRLSIFAGTFAHSAALEIGQTTPVQLARLTSYSLLRTKEDARYEIHDLLRQYITEKRIETPALDAAVQQAHMVYYAGWIADYVATWQKSFRTVTASTFQREFNNVQRAWHYAVETQQVGFLHQMAEPLMFCCNESSYNHYGDALLTEALTRLNPNVPIPSWQSYTCVADHSTPMQIGTKTLRPISKRP
ncbi:hypothetical protein KFU94_68540 [Chloroflexi bacterium TSY]|nr:hypothetical protein [Chloroflexi bacterium TSY]